MYRTSPKDKRSARGFTLVELLVAVALSAVLVLVLYSTFFTVIRAGESGSEGFTDLVRTSRLFDRLTRDVHAAFYRPTLEATSFKGGIKGSSSALSFTTLTRPAYSERAPSSGVVEVSYFLESGPDGTDLIREVKNVFTGTSVKVAAVEGVEGFEASYYNGLEWSKAWDTGLEGDIPVAVKVEVTLASGERLSTMARTMMR